MFFEHEFLLCKKAYKEYEFFKNNYFKSFKPFAKQNFSSHENINTFAEQTAPAEQVNKLSKQNFRLNDAQLSWGTTLFVFFEDEGENGGGCGGVEGMGLFDGDIVVSNFCCLKFYTKFVSKYQSVSIYYQ